MIVGGGYPASYFLQLNAAVVIELGRPPFGVNVANAIGASVPDAHGVALAAHESRSSVGNPTGVTLGGNLNVELT